MPRNMSFMYSKQQMRNRSKWVTRRTGWLFLKAGEIVNAVEQCQGLKKGEKIIRICQIRIVSVRRETLKAVDQRECNLEGFPLMTPATFRHFFMRSHKGFTLRTRLTRIQFDYCE